MCRKQCLLQWSTFLNFNTPLKEPHLAALGHNYITSRKYMLQPTQCIFLTLKIQITIMLLKTKLRHMRAYSIIQ